MLPCGVLVRLAALALLLLPATVLAQDQLSEARRLYNEQQYEAAERAARAAVAQTRTSNSGRVVLARVLLERYRSSSSAAQLLEARETLRSVNPAPLDPRERVELILGFGQGLFFEDRFAAAANVFEPIIGSAALLGAPAYDRALDWWATALDRYAATRPFGERPGIYGRITERMKTELIREPSSGPANYWLVAAAQGSGDLDTAWIMAQASWIRAGLGSTAATQTRAEIDRVVIEGTIPARAARVTGRDSNLVIAGMVGEWEAFKTAWTR